MFQLSSNRLTKAMPLVLGLMCCTPAVALAETEQLLTLTESSARDAVASPETENIAISTAPTNYAGASSYLLGPGDRIEVSVYGFPEYTGPYQSYLMALLPYR
jgi:polysaccharide export outer membrane protein